MEKLRIRKKDDFFEFYKDLPDGEIRLVATLTLHKDQGFINPPDWHEQLSEAVLRIKNLKSSDYPL